MEKKCKSDTMKKILFLLLILAGCFRCHAQTDPTLAGMILAYTDKAKSSLKAQEKAMMFETTVHLWIRKETEGVTDIQRKFNDYLDSFRDIICYAAQIYGFYHEIDRLTGNLGDLSHQLGTHGTNAIAVALTPRRNQIYRDVIMGSIDIVNDIRQVCLSDTKMTEKDRVEIVFAIRPKLKMMNRKIRHLIMAVRYTSLADVWAEIDEGSRPEKPDKAEITRRSIARWKRNCKR
jgi:hypothetical protein